MMALATTLLTVHRLVNVVGSALAAGIGVGGGVLHGK
jgi:hypothetical protein